MEFKNECSDLAIITISGGGGVTGKFDYLEIVNFMGVENILRKPFETSELRKMVSAVLEKNND